MRSEEFGMRKKGEGQPTFVPHSTLRIPHSPVVVPDRVKHIQRLYWLISRDGAMDHAAGNSPHFAGLQRPGFASDREGQFTFEQHPHLLVGMTVRLDDSPRLELDQRKH